ncbi:MAG TPA: hypothetical protein VJ784_10995 [Pyrinomonadaceae bacterium]|nr:hypothetical protein [Pyrinomonadaceae bacterium]
MIRKYRIRLIAASLVLICVALFVYARATRSSKNPYSLAGDLPRGALVYAQFQNLPELINQWQQSQLKERYLNSTSYQQLQHRHLAMKLISRWEEFNSALGFPLDLAAIGSSTDGAAAVAIYDIGQLDLLFVAPISDEKVALTQFFQSKDHFEEIEAPDGTPYYSQTVEADRGRQKQVLAFATVNGRFLLGTNEKLFLRALANINKRAKNDSIADDPTFKTLSRKVTPHFATIWVDQSKLNADYYFKHYWLMQNVAELKSIRAGIFDLEQQQSRWIERREFLTTGPAERSNSGIAAAELRRLYSRTPDDAPFVRLRTLANNPTLPGTIVRDTLFDSPVERESSSNSWSWDSYSSEDFYPTSGDDYDDYDRYSSLDDSYERTIDDPYDARVSERVEPGRNPQAAELENKFLTGLQNVLSPARPSSVAIATTPHTSKGPLFVEFRKVAIFNLQSPGNLRRELLEETVAHGAQGRLTVVNSGSQPRWEARNDWRSLSLPMLGWEICYALKDNLLVVSNSSEMMKAVLESRDKQSSVSAGIDELTIIRFDRRKESFDDIVNVLDADAIKHQQATNPDIKTSQEFFSGNISSLLNVAADVSRIEIKRKSLGNNLHEEIELVMSLTEKE